MLLCVGLYAVFMREGVDVSQTNVTSQRPNKGVPVGLEGSEGGRQCIAGV